MSRLAIIAGRGRLPALLKAARPEALLVGIETVPLDASLTADAMARLERFGALYEMLRAEGVDRLVLAGGLTRPQLDPSAFDAGTMALAPKLAAAMRGGDDGLLRVVIGAFEAEGFTVQGAHQILPELTLQAGPAPEALAADAARGRALLSALGPLDVGQACVVAQGLCLGIETAPGTEALLRFVEQTRGPLPVSGGVLVKAPKPGQDLRADMPAIGPGTVAQAQAAGLAGICIAPGGVLVLDRDEVLSRAGDAGIALWAEG
jgi:hypothetical protein